MEVVRRISRSASGGTAQDEADPNEAQPLLRRRSTTEGPERQQFQAARREAAQSAFFSWDSLRTPAGICVVCVLLPLVLAVPIFIIYVEVRSWFTLVMYYDKPCDQRLAMWLLVRNLLAVFTPRMPGPDVVEDNTVQRQRFKARLGALFSTSWLIAGYIMTSAAETCPKTNPELYNWVRFLAIFGMIVLVFSTTFPLLVLMAVMLYHLMVSRGWIRSPNAAHEDSINALEKVEYSPDLFKDSESQEDGPPADCCCCMEEFTREKPIVVTPCRHYFHQACLAEWLRLAKSCPLCRNNLDVSSNAGNATRSSPDAASSSGQTTV